MTGVNDKLKSRHRKKEKQIKNEEWEEMNGETTKTR